MILRDVTASVGRTPMVELARVAKGLPGRVAAKLEMRNPCGSVKDRVGVALIEDAERRGVLRPGVTLIEATGGNTGTGSSSPMPETMSTERVALLRHFGAEVLTWAFSAINSTHLVRAEVSRAVCPASVVELSRNGLEAL